jgi:hypothetical protein
MSLAAHAPSRLLGMLRRFAALAGGAGLLAVLAGGASGAGQSDPSFAPGGPLSVGAGRVSVAVADVNRDGKPDLVAARRDSNDVTILLGDGAGGFRPAGSPITVGRSPGALVLDDFNGDDKPDLVVANAGSSDLSILLGDGAGGFRPAAASPAKVAGLLAKVIGSDVNGDRHVDLLAVARDGATKRSPVVVLLGDGSGRFVPAPGSPLTFPGRSDGSALLTVADFNGDRKPDAAVGFDESAGISVRLGDGAGGFGAATRLLSGSTPRAFAAADVNRDGKADLAVTSSNKVTILLGNRLRAAAPIGLGQHEDPQQIVAADFSRDGKPDLAVNISSGLALLLGDGTGRFRPAADSPFAVPGVAIAAADFNGDDQPDLALDDSILFRTPATPAVVRGRALPGRPDAVFATRGVVTELSADGYRVAALTAVKKTCGRILIWTAPGSKSTRLDIRSCGSILCGTECAGSVALGSGQVAWLEESGGNSQETTVMATKLPGQAGKTIEHTANGNGAGGDPEGGYAGRLLGGGSQLASNTGQVVCSHKDPTYDYCDRWRLAKEKLVRIVDGRQVVVKRGAGACRLAAVGGGHLAVGGSVPWWDTGIETCAAGSLASSGAITVLAPSGRRDAPVPPSNRDPPRAIALSKTQLAVLRTFALDLYRPATGAKTKSLQLGPAAALQLTDVNARIARLRGPHRLVLVRLSDGKLISLPLQVRVARMLGDASLSEAGLFYAFTVPRASAKGRIAFEPTAKLLARF